MTAEALLLVGAMGVITAWIERRDGWRYAALSERTARLEERVQVLESKPSPAEPAEPTTNPPPWWAPWRR